jgi:hypothetical protein
MKYEMLQNYTDEKFRRIAGVKRKKMVEILPIRQSICDMGGHLSCGIEDMFCWPYGGIPYTHIAASFGLK